MLSAALALSLETDLSIFPELSPQPPRSWDFIGTAFVALIAYGVFVLTSWLALSVMLATHGVPKTISPAELKALTEQGHWYGGAVIAACPTTVAVLWIAIRNRRESFTDYLGLIWPSGGELFRALAVMAIILLAEPWARFFVGAEMPSSAFDDYRSARDSGALMIYLIAVCIAGPMMEEFVVRGFMFRGWSRSFLGPIGAIVLTSAVWALLHTQYDWFGDFVIFVTGLALGYFRWRSGSTWLTVMVHSATNFAIMLGIALTLAYP